MAFVTPAAFAYLSSQGSPASFISASGGTITYDGNYIIHTFTTTGSTDTFTVFSTGSAPYNTLELLIVAGGGGGTGADSNSCPPFTSSFGGTGSAGGAGGLIYSSSYSLTGSGAITVVVGSGSKNMVDNFKSGQNSTFGSLVAIGGGHGAADGSTLAATGGSGGGGVATIVNSFIISASFGASGSAGQGFNGANASSPITCTNTFNRLSGGGGGARANASTIFGGAGFTSSISGTPIEYARGGNATGVNEGFSLTPNRGTGGYGLIGIVNSSAKALATNGSSGVVIIRYQYQ
jgi:hypothetical protein